MRLLYVLPEFGPDVRGGIATFYRHLLPILAEAGHAIDVCVADPRVGTERTHGLGASVFGISQDAVDRGIGRFEHLALAPGLRSQLAAAYAAWERCRDDRYDVVEATDWGLLHAPWLASADGAPVVVQLHGSAGQVNFHTPLPGSELSGSMTRLIEAALLSRADQLQTYSTLNASWWSRILNRRVEHIPPAWRVDDLDDPGDRPAAASSDRPTGLIVGRVQSWKGPEVLCQAARLLGDANLSMVWVGGDHPHGRHASMSEALEESYPDVWGRMIRHVGEKSRDVTAEYQGRADYVVVPSDWDVFNLAAVEAMAAGKLVVCSDAAGAVDLIEAGVNGLRFRAGDASDLADQLRAVQGLTAVERARIGAEARRTVVERLDPRTIAEARVRQYEHLRGAGTTRLRHPWCEAMFGWPEHEPALSALDGTPLRQLVAYCGERSADKLRRKFERGS